MPSSPEFLDYVCDQVRSAGTVYWRPLFGEAMVYVNDRPMLLVCEDTVYVKKYKELESLLADAPRGLPYHWAVENYILDIDDQELCLQVVGVLSSVVPVPGAKKRR